MIDDPMPKVERLLAEGRTGDALDMLDRAASSGDDRALLRLAIFKLAGQFVSRDVAGARTLLAKATARNNIDAALFEIALTANGSGAPADWPKALGLLKSTAKASPVAAGQLALIERMSLTANGAPGRVSAIRKIGEKPNIWHAAQLFTPEECRHVAECAADILAPATVADPRTGNNVANPVRTSDGAVIGPTRETLVVQALNRRLAAVTQTEWRQGEALSVLRYLPGQQFRPHIDALPVTRNQRVRTVLIYLNDGFEGGCTFFAGNQLRISPRTGDAIIFDNVKADGAIDADALHAGEPVTKGVKWLATRWIRARPYDVWTGPEVA